MKNVKKLIAVVLCLALVSALIVSVYAAGEKPEGTADPDVVNVVFDANGGKIDGEDSKSVPASELKELPAASREHYTFAGWFDDEDAEVKDVDSLKDIEETVTLKARWNALVVFDVNGGKLADDAAAEVLPGELEKLPTATREGYNFGGWYDAEDKAVESVEGLADIKEPVVLTAKWNALVTFDANGGLFKDEGDETKSAQTYVTEAAGIESFDSVKVPVHETYSFYGWYVNAVGGEAADAAKLAAVTEPTTVYAHWYPEVTFDANGGKIGDKDVVVVANVELKELQTATREGYEFMGWYENGKVVADAAALADNKDHVLVAMWNIPVTFDANGGKIGDDTKTTVYVTELGEDFPEVTHESYDSVFGWYTAAEGGERVEFDSLRKVKEPVTVYAHYYPEVTFNANGGKIGELESVIAANVELKELQTATREGYKFLGWYEGETLVSNVAAIADGKDHVLTARWSLVIVFDANGGKIGEADKLTTTVDELGEDFPAVKHATYEKVFGWYTAPKGGERVEFAAVKAAEKTMTVYAHYYPEVIFDAANGKLPEDASSIVKKSDLKALPIPTRDDYTFAGWLDAKQKVVTGLEAIPDDEDYVVTAYWVANITLDANGGKLATDQKNVVRVDQLTVLPVPERTGYLFGGWSLDATDTIVSDVKVLNDGKPHTLKAVWNDIRSNYVNYTDHFGYLIGFDDGTIRPDAEITRGEVASILFRLLTDKTRQDNWKMSNPFSDVKADAWYNNAVSTLYSMKVIDGFQDNTYKPDAPITRAEIAALVTRLYNMDSSVVIPHAVYKDLDPNKVEWYTPYVDKAVFLGLMQGYLDGTFKPDQNLTRAEAITIFNRLLGRNPHKDHLYNGMTTWTDNKNPNEWYYAQIQEATCSHTYKNIVIDGVTYENWTGLKANRDWSLFEKAWSTPDGSTPTAIK